MRYVLFSLSFIFCIELFGITFVDESQYADNIVGNKHLKGAKFLGETIWQDQPINEKINLFTYEEAYNYCKNLKLLGIQKWRLPIRTDFMILDKEMKKLRYRASRDGCSYFTQTPAKNGKVYEADISLDNSLPYISTTKKNYKNSVRCVLNPNIYNQYQIAKAKQISNSKTIDSYLDAFLRSGNKAYIQNAIKMAKTKKDNAKIEATLYRYLGFFKVFDLLKNGEILSKKTQSYDSDNRLMAMIKKNKRLQYSFTIRQKKDTPLPLKYNTYAVTIDFKLELKYFTVAVGVGMSSKKVLHVNKTFILSKKNNYQNTIVVDFGNIEQGTKARAIVLDYSNKLTNATLSYDVKDTEITIDK